MDKTKYLVSFLNVFPDSAFVLFDQNLRCHFAGGSMLGHCGVRFESGGDCPKIFFAPEDEQLCREALLGKRAEAERVIQSRFFKIQACPVVQEAENGIGGALFFQDRTALYREAENLRLRNQSLKDTLSQLEEDKQCLKKQITANIQNVLLPLLEKLKLSRPEGQGIYAELLEKNLKELTSSFGLKISERFYRLTPKEIQICVMIKNGLSSREIGRLLNISEGTIESHRNHIRRKLGIAGKNVNLSAHLQTFEGF